MKLKYSVSMLILAFVAVAGFNVQVAEANSPASVHNRSNCALNIAYVTDQNTLFGPQLVLPGESYDIKVPTGESIVKIGVNNVSNDPNIAVGTCAVLESGPAICITPATRFCRRDTQVWVIF